VPADGEGEVVILGAAVLLERMACDRLRVCCWTGLERERARMDAVREMDLVVVRRVWRTVAILCFVSPSRLVGEWEAGLWLRGIGPEVRRRSRNRSAARIQGRISCRLLGIVRWGSGGSNRPEPFDENPTMLLIGTQMRWER
jgi:hypothetical protein